MLILSQTAWRPESLDPNAALIRRWQPRHVHKWTSNSSSPGRQSKQTNKQGWGQGKRVIQKQTESPRNRNTGNQRNAQRCSATHTVQNYTVIECENQAYKGWAKQGNDKLEGTPLWFGLKKHLLLLLLWMLKTVVLLNFVMKK